MSNLNIFFNIRAEESGLTPNERHIVLRFCGQYTNELLPYLTKCFEQIIPMKSMANKLGVSVIEFNEVKTHLPTIDVESAAHSVTRLLPTQHTISDVFESVPVVTHIETSDSTQDNSPLK